MKKRDMSVEQQKLLKNGSGHILMSNTTDVLVVGNKACYILHLAGFECLPSQQKVREAYRGTHMNVPAGSQHMKTIHFPKSMMSAPFLQVRIQPAEGGTGIIGIEEMDDDADQAEKVSKEKLQKEAEIRRLKEEDAELMERKQKLQLRVCIKTSWSKWSK
ncbi:hypothetical protein GBF38_003950 [Nibea albiflora]|uniref:Uncharacterized protein n=1 Tax=Nibea albiflora TaxID=240163 RepID=A0ACB7FCD6_NIBAL|nr:hypothetical protein GBF38_003950 [Nibea albiflora]